MSGTDSDVTVVDPHGHLIGSTVGPWLVLERLDSGSFGVVFRARRAGHADAPPVALKIAKSSNDPRFEREVQVLEDGGPGLPRFEDRGLWTGPKGRKYPYFTMELVEGLPLYDWGAEAPRSSREVLQVLAQLAAALAHAHARGVFHRDVKGDNIRVTPEGRAVLLDWGSVHVPRARQLTDTAAPPGTTAYRAPEVLRFAYRFRKDLEARWESRPSDDLYALGVTLYRLTTGTYPPSYTEGGRPVKSTPPPPWQLATVAPALERMILALLSDLPATRGTAAELAQQSLELLQEPQGMLDLPIRPLRQHVSPADEFSSEGERDEEVLSDTAPASYRSRWVRAWRTGLASAAVCMGVFLAFLGGVLVPREEAPQRHELLLPEEAARFTPDAGMGEEALHAVPGVFLPQILALGRPMPSKPFPGQRRPPCAPRVEREINGACWVGVLGEKPPCGDRMFDYEGACYLASFNEGRRPTSEEP